MPALSKQILEAAAKFPEGFLLAAKQFLALGKRDAVDQTLRRLAARGKLVKITRGRYALPISSRFGTRPPAPELVIAQLNRDGAQQLVSSGAAAANALGLTTQMPVQQTFLARTRSQKRYVFGKQEVTIRSAAACNFLLSSQPAGEAIRALTWLGPDQAAAALPTLRRVLPPQEWDALLSVSSELPPWLAQLLSEQAFETQKARG